ncbi:MAG: hypothetical protein GY762_16160 [Proteobacteria bacterium]|nr:hypothetical protein [Pseudomonadota bacterium]
MGKDPWSPIISNADFCRIFFLWYAFIKRSGRELARREALLVNQLGQFGTLDYGTLLMSAA